MGLDNSDGDKFKISSDGDLNTNARLTIDTSGNATFAGTVKAEYHTLMDGGTTCGQFVREETITGAGSSQDVCLFSETGLDLHFMTGGSVTKVLTLDTSNNATFAGTITAGGAPVMSKTVWCGWQGSHNTTASSWESPSLNTHEIAVDTDYATISGTTITIVQAGYYLVKMTTLQHTDGGVRYVRIIVDGVNKSYTYHSGVTDWQSEVSDYSAYMAQGTEIYFQCYVTGTTPYAFHRIDSSMHSYATLIYLGK
jgi:hypothetical protein